MSYKLLVLYRTAVHQSFEVRHDLRFYEMCEMGVQVFRDTTNCVFLRGTPCQTTSILHTLAPQAHPLHCSLEWLH